MKITNQIEKSNKGKIFYKSLPPSGKINFFLEIEEDFDGLVTFFSALEVSGDPVLHLSLENIKNKYYIVLGRYNFDENMWMHLRSEVEIEKNKEYSIEILYGKCKNKIEIGNQSKDLFIESENMEFVHRSNLFLIFGDSKKINKIPIELKNFTIRKMYDGKNTCIFNVQKPKILDNKMLREFM